MPKELTPRNQAIINALADFGHDTPDNAIPVMEVANTAYERNPEVFTSEPNPSTAAAAMTGIFREVPGLHRIMGENRGYLYYYDPSKKTPRDVQQRSSRIAEVEEAVASVKKPKAKSWPQRSTKAVKIIASHANNQMPSANRQGGDYVIVKKPDGQPAGVVKDGILYDSLEVLVQTLNSTLRTS